MGRLLLSAAFLSLLLSFSLFSEVGSTTFKIVNKCRHTIWPGILTGANRPPLNPTGFTLRSGGSRTLRVPRAWSGRVWARTHCSAASGERFSCATADCASGRVECGGAGAIPPATLAEFTLNGDAGLDFYDVSLVDGYNLPMLIVARGGGGRGGACSPTGCLVDLNGACPRELSVARGNGSRESVACRSACEAQKLLSARKDSAELPLVNKSMMYIGRHHARLSSPAAFGATFTFVNKCDHTVWPGILANAGSPSLDTTGFELPQDSTRSFSAPAGWSGRFWGRTGCAFSGSSQGAACLTGDCGSGREECGGLGAAPPATLAEVTLGAGGGLDFYDVSLVDGYNLPMVIETTGGTGTCASTGCVTDLNRACPAELRFISYFTEEMH
ncbi:pathogenesis-related thaumatin superfamily protein [Striga asiatica]|uniref:Pathogenesis-related thaumatin superfamily protein n=1 Tax=Striga asiatica TaxID=4170 RepID=A0A5A7QYS9_STRAF|nr:pathogenesis-related thaumatin superfamily protein [Striga asiatica]